jgi:hypothetical protein
MLAFGTRVSARISECFVSYPGKTSGFSVAERKASSACTAVIVSNAYWHFERRCDVISLDLKKFGYHWQEPYCHGLLRVETFRSSAVEVTETEKVKAHRPSVPNTSEYDYQYN